MKKLIVCCDGTWNTPDQEEYELPAPTNVLRLYNALSARDAAGNRQLRYYHPGVGTEGGFLARTAGGMYGRGLGQNVMSAYSWLGRHYEPGDKVYLFGFSRGAFTARSLAGMLSHCGLLDLRNAVPPFEDTLKRQTVLAAADAWKRVETAYDEGYRGRQTNWRQSDWDLSEQPGMSIEFIGVWDTVGALGIPNDMAILNLLDNPRNWSFHDVTLGDNTKFARHAIAMDEMRSSFAPTLWTDKDGNVLHDPVPSAGAARVRQVYFPGVHSDVGGGYYECGLADAALQWMIKEAVGVPDGIAFEDSYTKQICPRAQAPIHNSVRGAFKALRTRPRNLPAFDQTDRYSDSAKERLKEAPIFQSPYHEPVRVSQPGGGTRGSDTGETHSSSDRKLNAIGEYTSCTIYAAMPWNPTGVYLEAGVQYRFEAVGEWMDGDITCGPAGTNDGKFQPGEIAQLAGSAVGALESLFKKVTGNDQADFPMTKRYENVPWFSLVGVVANDMKADGTRPEGPNEDGSPPDHQMIPIGRGGNTTVNITASGHLYAFANDAWHFYDNNRGSVTLRITRAS